MSNTIESAPKNRPVLLWHRSHWVEGKWDEFGGISLEGGWMLRRPETDAYSIFIEGEQPHFWCEIPPMPYLVIDSCEGCHYETATILVYPVGHTFISPLPSEHKREQSSE